MARRRGGRSVRKSRDLVWITTVIEVAMVEGTLDIGQLIVASDWSQGNAGFDRATIMAVRGWISYAQTAAATGSEATMLSIAMYLTDGQTPANSMDPALAADYAVFDTIWTDGQALSANTGTGAAPLSRQIDVRARRKITTASDLRLAATVSADTVTPRCSVNAVIRVLLRLDPPS